MGIEERKRKKRIKDYVIERDGMLCCYCDQVLTPETVTLEHIVPDSKRGTFNATNLTIACSFHNNQRGNKPFFKYCQQFNWASDKIEKYHKLYFNNLKIKVLNIAKEVYSREISVPNEIIREACIFLKIRQISFAGYEEEYHFDIKFNELCDRRKIKFIFEQLIRIIELDN